MADEDITRVPVKAIEKLADLSEQSRSVVTLIQAGLENGAGDPRVTDLVIANALETVRGLHHEIEARLRDLV